MADRLAKHRPGRSRQASRLVISDLVGRAGRVDPGPEQDLAGVQVADPGHQSLVEHRHLDRPPRPLAQPTPVGGHQRQGIGAQTRWPKPVSQLLGCQQPDRSQPATVPEIEVIDEIGRVTGLQTPVISQVTTVRRIGDQHQARHPRLDHKRIGRREIHDHPLADPTNSGDARTPGPTADRSRSRSDLDRTEPAAVPPGLGQTTTGHVPGNPPHHRLDLGQFGHWGVLSLWETARRLENSMRLRSSDCAVSCCREACNGCPTRQRRFCWWNLIDDLAKLHNALDRDYPEYRIPTPG